MRCAVNDIVACEHGAVRSEIIGSTVYVKPAGLHPAGLIEVVPFVVNHLPAALCIAAVSMSVPPFARAVGCLYPLSLSCRSVGAYNIDRTVSCARVCAASAGEIFILRADP